MSPIWMPLYVKDFKADTDHLTHEERGVYLTLIMHYWLHGSIPTDDRQIAKILHIRDAKWRAIAPSVRGFFDADFRHKRIDAELEKANNISEVRRMARFGQGKKSADKDTTNVDQQSGHLSTQSQSQSQKQGSRPKKGRGEVVVEQTTEPFQHEPFPSEIPVDPGDEIEFENGVVKITAAMLSTWQRRYPGVNVLAKIETLATWINGQCRSGGKDWKELSATMLKKDYDAIREREMSLRIRAEADAKNATKPKLSMV